jgi:hypothetical protein
MNQSTLKVNQLLTPTIGLAFLSSGAALLAYVIFRLSMGLSLICAFAIVVGLVVWQLYAIDSARRVAFVRLLGKGAVIGLLATIAYDAVRLLIVGLFAMPINPFKAFPYFGYAIGGELIAPTSAIAIGTLYHFTNGIFFSVSYSLLLGSRRWFYGVLWAVGLEILMVAIYPTWLNLDAVMNEFMEVSLAGHLAYGAVLGMMSRSMIKS